MNEEPPRTLFSLPDSSRQLCYDSTPDTEVSTLAVGPVVYRIAAARPARGPQHRANLANRHFRDWTPADCQRSRPHRGSRERVRIAARTATPIGALGCARAVERQPSFSCPRRAPRGAR